MKQYTIAINAFVSILFGTTYYKTKLSTLLLSSCLFSAFHFAGTTVSESLVVFLRRLALIVSIHIVVVAGLVVLLVDRLDVVAWHLAGKCFGC